MLPTPVPEIQRTNLATTVRFEIHFVLVLSFKLKNYVHCRYYN